MSQTFDPYRTWFGISQQEQPPNHYRLLGVHDFESDLERIRDAGEKRVQFLQDVSTGQYVTEAQTLLNQVASAVVCLTNPNKKSAYDSQLRNKEAPKVQVAGNPSPQISAPSKSNRASKKPPVKKSTAKTPVRRGKKKASFPIWGYFVTIPVMLAAAAGAFLIIKGKTDKVPDKDSGVEFNQNWESGKTVSEDFRKASASDRNFNSQIGSWEFGNGVAINDTKESGQKYLQLAGGSNRIAAVKLSGDVDRKGILTLSLKRWSSRVEFVLEVQASADGTNWKTIPEASYSGKVPEGRQAGQPWSAIYALSDPAMTHLRLKCNSKVYADKKQGGLLIDTIMIEPSLH